APLIAWAMKGTGDIAASGTKTWKTNCVVSTNAPPDEQAWGGKRPGTLRGTLGIVWTDRNRRPGRRPVTTPRALARLQAVGAAALNKSRPGCPHLVPLPSDDIRWERVPQRAPGLLFELHGSRCGCAIRLIGTMLNGREAASSPSTTIRTA